MSEELTLEQQAEVACKATGRKWSVDPFRTGVFADEDRTLWCPGTEHQLQRSQLYAVVEFIARRIKALHAFGKHHEAHAFRLIWCEAVATGDVSSLVRLAWKLD